MPGYSKSAFFEAIKESIRDPVPPEVRVVCVLVCVCKVEDTAADVCFNRALLEP
jgi:hypothetical protein